MLLVLEDKLGLAELHRDALESFIARRSLP